MSDLISRQAAIEAVGLNTWAGSRLAQIPHADAELVKHGQWESGKCSICGADEPYTESGFWVETAYCPNCGAKMEIEGEDHE